MPDTAETKTQRLKPSKFISTVYIQFSGVLGALSIASLLSHLIKWKGLIHAVVTWWADVVRPVVDLVFWPVVHLLDKYLLPDFFIPIVVKDYLAVGIIFTLSRWRGATVGWEGGTSAAVGKIFRRFFKAAELLLRSLFLWPAEMVTVFLNFLYARKRFPDRADKDIRQIRIAHFLSLLPVLYALFIVIANVVVGS